MYPFELLPFPRLGDTRPAPADIERHQQMELGIKVTRECQRCEALLLDVDTQLLFQLADQTLLRPFAGLHLAAGKLPKSRHRFPFRTLREQHASVGIDERAGGNKDNVD